MIERVIILGAGHGGVQAAVSLREQGFKGELVLVSDELDMPYQKPPLSKGYLQGKQSAEAIRFRSDNYYKDNHIELRLGVKIVQIKPDAKQLISATGEVLSYDYLILAIGANNRQLKCGGRPVEHALYLRNFEDARRIEEALKKANDIVIIGGGFIGLELAALATEKGKKVSVVESQDRLMKRVLPVELSTVFYETHKQKGVDILLNTSVQDCKGGKEVHLTNSSVLKTDLILVGIGVVVDEELIKKAGITFENGIEVNVFQQTNIPNIYAIGDCANHYNHYAQKKIRLESVQNAIDQATVAASHISGKPVEYKAVPWFWTHQYHLKLQMAGFSIGFEEAVIRKSAKPERFSVYYFKGDRLLGVDSLNRPVDHLNARKLLAANIFPTKEQVADPDFSLKTLLS